MSPKAAKDLLGAIRQIATRELQSSGTFKLPALVSFRLFHKAASPAKMKVMFGKNVLVARKPARSVIKVTPTKQLRDALADS